jgi:hypothetical protein
LHDHCRLVEALADAGVAPPDAWLQLRDRLTAFVALDAAAPMRARLVAAIVDGDPDADIAALRANAFAEQLGVAKVTSTVRSAVTARLRETYAAVALDNYGSVATQFDDWATKFSTVAAAVDVEAEGAAMVDQPDKARKAWLDAERFAHRLTRSMGTLHAAARLAGAPETAHRDIGGRDAILIPLCVNPTDLHRRRVWEAWANTEGRCGRWSALHAAGVPIRALPADQLATFEPYRAPKPLREDWIPIARGISQSVIVDPEDTQPEQPEPAKRPRIRELAP